MLVFNIAGSWSVYLFFWSVYECLVITFALFQHTDILIFKEITLSLQATFSIKLLHKPVRL